MSRGSKRPAVAMPTVEEDKAITAAARRDRDKRLDALAHELELAYVQAAH